jgi:hypothetical protein
MAIQFNVATRNARLDTIESTNGTSCSLEIRSGTVPANCAATRTGTAGHFCVYNSQATKDGTTCFIQGTVTATGGGGDMEVSSTSFTSGQSFTVSTFTLTDGNA